MASPGLNSNLNYLGPCQNCHFDQWHTGFSPDAQQNCDKCQKKECRMPGCTNQVNGNNPHCSESGHDEPRCKVQGCVNAVQGNRNNCGRDGHTNPGCKWPLKCAQGRLDGHEYCRQHLWKRNQCLNEPCRNARLPNFPTCGQSECFDKIVPHDHSHRWWHLENDAPYPSWGTT